jgi:hypothetical protein
VSAPSKRRHFSYYLSLPVIVLVVLLLVAKLVAMQRAEIIAELSERIAHRDPDDASAAVRQLGEMPRPPASVLVEAASSVDRKLAREGQQTIDKLLRRAKQQLEARRGVKAVSRQLTELARELADNRHAFAMSDRPWLIGTTQQILSLANRVPSKHSPAVAANCDLILTFMSSHPTTPTMPAATNILTDRPLKPDLNNAVAATGSHVDPATKNKSLPGTSRESPFIAPWRSDWNQPVFRSIPSSPNSQSPATGALPASPRELPSEIDLLSRPPANPDIRALLQKWHESNGQQLTIAERQQLADCGFHQLPAELLHKLFATPDVRLQLVDDVLQAPGINVRPWLSLLSEDADAEVRLAAVTTMAASDDPALVEQAWQAAIRDRDPRVAALAARLQARRAAIKRR